MGFLVSEVLLQAPAGSFTNYSSVKGDTCIPTINLHVLPSNQSRNITHNKVSALNELPYPDVCDRSQIFWKRPSVYIYTFI